MSHDHEGTDPSLEPVAPQAAVVGIDRLEQLQQLEDDLRDIALVAARMATTGPRRHSLDEVLARFGYTREQVRDLPE